FTPIVWFMTDRIIEPRLNALNPRRLEEAPIQPQDAQEAGLNSAEKRGLMFAGLTVLGMLALWALITWIPGSPFVDTAAEPAQRFNPLFKSLAAFFAVTFFLSGAAYGFGSGSVSSHHDLVR